MNGDPRLLILAGTFALLVVALALLVVAIVGAVRSRHSHVAEAPAQPNQPDVQAPIDTDLSDLHSETRDDSAVQPGARQERASVEPEPAPQAAETVVDAASPKTDGPPAAVESELGANSGTSLEPRLEVAEEPAGSIEIEAPAEVESASVRHAPAVPEVEPASQPSHEGTRESRSEPDWSALLASLEAEDDHPSEVSGFAETASPTQAPESSRVEAQENNPRTQRPTAAAHSAPAPAEAPAPAAEKPRAPRPVVRVHGVPSTSEPAASSERTETREVAEYVLEAPVEMWFGEERVGVRPGSPAAARFLRYANALLADVRAAREVPDRHS